MLQVSLATKQDMIASHHCISEEGAWGRTVQSPNCKMAGAPVWANVSKILLACSEVYVLLSAPW